MNITGHMPGIFFKNREKLHKNKFFAKNYIKYLDKYIVCLIY